MYNILLNLHGSFLLIDHNNLDFTVDIYINLLLYKAKYHRLVEGPTAKPVIPPLHN